MLVEPVLPPVVDQPTNVPAGLAADRARAARGWLDQARHHATTPGIGDPTPALANALGAATDAIREAIEACAELHAVQGDLHLALDEAAAGLAQVDALGAGAREAVLRCTNLAGGMLDRAIAALAELAATAPDADDPVR